MEGDAVAKKEGKVDGGGGSIAPPVDGAAGPLRGGNDDGDGIKSASVSHRPASPLAPSLRQGGGGREGGGNAADAEGVGGAASSEEESVAELGDVSEGESSSLDDFHHPPVKKYFSSGVMEVAKRLQSSAPVVKCTRFSEPADDNESLVETPTGKGEVGTGPITGPSGGVSIVEARAGAGRAGAGGGSSSSGRPQNMIPKGKVKPKLSGNIGNAKGVPKVLPAAAKGKRSLGPPILKEPNFRGMQPPAVKFRADSDEIDHSPTSLPRFKNPRDCMWTSSHAANSPSEDRSASLVNVLLQPLPPNLDSETQLPPLQEDYTSLVRLSLWSVIDGHGGGSVATYASEVLLPHIAASVSRSLGCAIVDRGMCIVNGQLRDANALDLDGLIKTSDRSPANSHSIHYRSPYEASDSDDEEDGDVHVPRGVLQSDTHDDSEECDQSHASTATATVPSQEPAASVSSAVASISSVKTSVKTAASPAARDAPAGTHSPGEVAAITRAITESFLAVDEGWINSIDPVATHQTSCQSNGRWNSGACALVVFTIQRLEWTSVSEAGRGSDPWGPEKCRGHDTSQNKDAARRRMLDYRAKSASSLSTISSTSSLTTTEDGVNVSGLESEITETEGEDDEHTSDDKKSRRRFSSKTRSSARGANLPKESLISAPGTCGCHSYRAFDALLYTAHVGDCRAVMLGSAPPRTIKVHGSVASHTDATDDESSHHSSDETECLSSSDHDADSSDDEDIDDQKTASAKTTTPYMTFARRPTRRKSRRRANDELGTNAPFIALPPLEAFKSVELEIDSEGERDVRRRAARKRPSREMSDTMSSSSSSPSTSSPSSQGSREEPVTISLPPVTRPIDLTTDHSAYNPAEVTAVLRRCNNAPRAISAGVGGGIKRVAGSLAVTRALGDAYLKTPMLSFFPYKRHAPYITARPEVNCRPVNKDGDKVLILATDGVWERASGEDVLRWARTFYAERTAEAERRKNRRQSGAPPNVAPAPPLAPPAAATAVTLETNEDDKAMNAAAPAPIAVATNVESDAEGSHRKLPEPPSSPTAKRRKLSRSKSSSGSLTGHGHGHRHHHLAVKQSTVADVIVRRVLNKVRRARNISSLHALMSLPPGRARRSKHDDITASIVDLSAFVS